MFPVQVRTRDTEDIEEPPPEEEARQTAEGGSWSPGERVTLTWASGWRAHLHALIAHAHLKLLCLGPSLCEYPLVATDSTFKEPSLQFYLVDCFDGGHLADSIQNGGPTPKSLSLHFYLVKGLNGGHLVDSVQNGRPNSKMAAPSQRCIKFDS